MAGNKNSGKPKTPTKLTLLKGKKSHKKKEAGEEPDPDMVKDLTAPDYLDAVGKKEWKRVAPKLLDLGLLSHLDLPALGVYCVSYSRFIKATNALKKEQLITQHRTGAIGPNALVGIMNSSAKLMREFMQEFGMTPSARARIKLPAKKKVESARRKAL